MLFIWFYIFIFKNEKKYFEIKNKIWLCFVLKYVFVEKWILYVYFIVKYNKDYMYFYMIIYICVRKWEIFKWELDIDNLNLLK